MTTTTSPVRVAVAPLFACDNCGAEMRASDETCPRCRRDFRARPPAVKPAAEETSCPFCSPAAPCVTCLDERSFGSSPPSAKDADAEEWLPPALREQALVGAEAIRAAAKRSVSYEWEGIARTGNIVALAGLPGDGKTTAMGILLAARRNRTGVPISVFGRPLKPAPLEKYLILVENEIDEAASSRTLEASREMLGLGEDTFERVIVLGRKDVTVRSKLWAAVCALIERGMVDSVYIDSLARFLDGESDSNDERDQVGVFAEVQRAIESSPGDAKPMVFIVCHSNKSSKGGDVRDISGSVQRAAQVDVAILITADRNDNLRVVSATAKFVKVREASDEWPKASTFRTAKIDGRWVLEWDGSAAATPTKRALHERAYELVVSEALTKTELGRRLSASHKAVDEAIAVLRAEGRIKFEKRNVRGKDTWFIAPKDPKAQLKSLGIVRSANDPGPREEEVANDHPF